MPTLEQKKKEELNVLFRLAGLMPEVQAAEPESYGPMPVAAPTVAPIPPAPIPTVGPRDFSSKSNMKRLETQDQTIGTKGVSQITEAGEKETKGIETGEKDTQQTKYGLITKKGLSPQEAIKSANIIFEPARREARAQLEEAKKVNFESIAGQKNLSRADAKLQELATKGFDPNDPLFKSVTEEVQRIQREVSTDKNALDAVYRGDVEAALNEIKDAEKNELSTGEIVARIVIGLAPALIGAAAAGPLGGYYAGQAGVNALDQMNKDEREKIKQLREAAKERLKLLKDKYKEDLDSLNKRAEKASEMGQKFNTEMAMQALKNKYEAAFKQVNLAVDQAKLELEQSKERNKLISDARKGVVDLEKEAAKGALGKVQQQTTTTFGDTQTSMISSAVKEAIDVTQKNIGKIQDETKQIQGQKVTGEQKEVTGVKAVGKGKEGIATTLTPAQKKADEAFGKRYEEYMSGGGSAAVKRTLDQLKDAQKQLESGEQLTGPLYGRISEAARPKTRALRQQIESGIQNTLKQILGSQFRGDEAAGLFQRSFDETLSEAENAKKLNFTIRELEDRANAMSSAANQYEQTGSIVGLDTEKIRVPKADTSSQEYKKSVIQKMDRPTFDRYIKANPVERQKIFKEFESK